MTPRRTKLHTLLAALVLAISFGAVTAAPALADGRGHERAEHRGHEWRGQERDWRGHEWREHRPYHYGYAYPSYYGYYAPPTVYAPPPSLTVVVPFR